MFRYQIAEAGQPSPQPPIRLQPVRLVQSESNARVEVLDDSGDWHIILSLAGDGTVFRSLKTTREVYRLERLGLQFDARGKIQLRGEDA